MRCPSLFAVLLLLSPGCALIDGLRGDDEPPLLTGCQDRVCFDSVLAENGSGPPTAISSFNGEFFVGNAAGEMMVVPPGAAAMGMFGRLESGTTGSPVLSIAAGEFEVANRTDIATSRRGAGDDIEYDLFIGIGSGQGYAGDAPPGNPDGNIIVCNSTLAGRDELIISRLDEVQAHDIMAGMPAPTFETATFPPPSGKAYAQVLCADVNQDDADDLVLLAKNDNELIVLFNNGATFDAGTRSFTTLPVQPGTTPQAISWNESTATVAVAYHCETCFTDWDAVVEFGFVSEDEPLMLRRALRLQEPFRTAAFALADYDGDSIPDFALGGEPLVAPPMAMEPPPNLVILWGANFAPQTMGMAPPTAYGVANSFGEEAPIVDMLPGQINNEPGADLAVLLFAGPGTLELHYLTGDEAGPNLEPPPMMMP